MKKILFLVFTATAFSYSCAPLKKEIPAIPVTEVTPVSSPISTQLDSASYAFGASIANDLKSRGVTNLDYSLVTKAMNDVFSGGTPILSPEKCHEVINNYLTLIDKNKSESAIAEANNFLTENKKKAGIITLPSGLQYEVLRPGSGAKPALTDEVTVHYKGTLLNGKQFDSSYDRGEPTTFMLNQVIPGWTEGLQQMSQGSKYRFYIPYSLAYGERGAGQDIPPYSTLIFEVELIKIGK